MELQTTVLMGILGILFLAGLLLVFFFVKSIRNRRRESTEVLPDLDELEIEDDVLPDIDESSFAQVGGDFSAAEESATEIYDEIYDEESRR